MNIQEAIKSGRRFRRKSWDTDDSMWCHVADGTDDEPEVGFVDGSRFYPLVAGLSADDWEIQEPTITITLAQFQAAIDATLPKIQDNSLNNLMRYNMRRVAEELGLEEKKK